MPVPCSICKHVKRSEIDTAVLTDGASKALATRFGVSLFALKRHRAHTAELIASTPTKKLMAATDVDAIIAKAEKLERRAEGILDKAENNGDYRAALDAVGRLTKVLEFLATISGAMHRPSQTTNNTNIFVSEEKLDEIIARRAAKFQDDRRREIPALPSPSGN